MGGSETMGQMGEATIDEAARRRSAVLAGSTQAGLRRSGCHLPPRVIGGFTR